jgi:arylsulfatase
VTRGYDRYYGMLGGCENHFNPGSAAIAGQPTPTHKDNGNRWALDGREVDDFVPQDPNFYDTDAFTDRALQWLDEYQTTNQAVSALHGVHGPPLAAHGETGRHRQIPRGI